MRTLIFVMMLGLTGCASTSWRATASAKTNFKEANNDCKVKAAVAVKKEGANDFGYGIRKNAFMRECLEGQGFESASN